MKTLTVHITPEMAKKLLAMSEGELEELRRKLAAKELEFAELKRAVSEVDSEPTRSLPLSVEKNPASGRTKRGESERVVFSFLDSHRGSGWAQSEIVKKTDLPVSTVRRALIRLAKAGKIDGGSGSWGIS